MVDFVKKEIQGINVKILYALEEIYDPVVMFVKLRLNMYCKSSYYYLWKNWMSNSTHA